MFRTWLELHSALVGYEPEPQNFTGGKREADEVSVYIRTGLLFNGGEPQQSPKPRSCETPFLSPLEENTHLAPRNRLCKHDADSRQYFNLPWC
jgi:hypothetical protein